MHTYGFGMVHCYCDGYDCSRYHHHLPLGRKKSIQTFQLLVIHLISSHQIAVVVLLQFVLRLLFFCSPCWALVLYCVESCRSRRRLASVYFVLAVFVYTYFFHVLCPCFGRGSCARTSTVPSGNRAWVSFSKEKMCP